MKIIDGKSVAASIREEAARAAAAVAAARGSAPGLAVVLVGENPASVSYVTAKERACAECGIRSIPVRMPAESSQEEILSAVRRLGADPSVDGILVQLPLPRGIDEQAVIRAIPPEKDVDGFHPVSLGNLVIGLPGFVPCTPAGIVELLMRSGVDPAGKHVVVVGRSNIVGKPVAALLARKGRGGNATVTLCHTATPDLCAFTRQADILVVAAGRPGTVGAGMVKPGAVVVDVGVNRVPDATKKRGYRLVGDVDFDAVAPVASMITPVPGGVGPMTIAMLMANAVKAAGGPL
ncbi:MAG: bifunctional methylenetetrahydrofolate dehydrogenase/methenyltetrahydrofolate cyclohydrolase FolD [Kiritimatiellae bacterium]|nr:bifunctional methylenetetrahydrofolate dehydrogenase/methenyltetrahydrofolate cyclohydrolase FolD [Kiritimatiellia bacterium]MBR1837013.1 bifunctional methylenetetrahydrofolate dehydrogenase/methenyltetrahydrofolate cyclohydrolase FolD [Kiritimatiellia bacterium]